MTLKDFGTAQLVFDVSCLIGQGLDDCSSSLTSRVTLHVYVTPKALTGWSWARSVVCQAQIWHVLLSFRTRTTVSSCADPFYRLTLSVYVVVSTAQSVSWSCKSMCYKYHQPLCKPVKTNHVCAMQCLLNLSMNDCTCRCAHVLGIYWNSCDVAVMKYVWVCVGIEFRMFVWLYSYTSTIKPSVRTLQTRRNSLVLNQRRTALQKYGRKV